jgi:hypothetical protein
MMVVASPTRASQNAVPPSPDEAASTINAYRRLTAANTTSARTKKRRKNFV